MPPSEFADKFVIRLPNGMRDRIRERADENHRSMNAEIVHCLHSVLAVSSKTKGSASAPTLPSHDHQQPR